MALLLSIANQKSILISEVQNNKSCSHGLNPERVCGEKKMFSQFRVTDARSDLRPSIFISLVPLILVAPFHTRPSCLIPRPTSLNIVPHVGDRQ